MNIEYYGFTDKCMLLIILNVLITTLNKQSTIDFRGKMPFKSAQIMREGEKLSWLDQGKL